MRILARREVKWWSAPKCSKNPGQALGSVGNFTRNHTLNSKLGQFFGAGAFVVFGGEKRKREKRRKLGRGKWEMRWRSWQPFLPTMYLCSSDTDDYLIKCKETSHQHCWLWLVKGSRLIMLFIALFVAWYYVQLSLSKACYSKRASPACHIIVTLTVNVTMIMMNNIIV